MVNSAPGNGLDLQLRTGATGRKCQPEALAGGLGVIDYDGDGTRERRTSSRVVRSLREFASPDSNSIQPSLKPSIIRILGMGFFMPCERNSFSHWSRGTSSDRTGRSSTVLKPAAISFAE